MRQTARPSPRTTAGPFVSSFPPSTSGRARSGSDRNAPLAAIEDEHALIVYEADGAPLPPDHGWPVRLFVPTKYFWKSAKWLRSERAARSDRGRARVDRL